MIGLVTFVLVFAILANINKAQAPNGFSYNNMSNPGFNPSAQQLWGSPSGQGQSFGGQPQGQDQNGGQQQGQGFNGGQPQGQGFNGGQPQGQGFNGGQPQGQGFNGGQPQGQGFNGGQPQGQDFSGGQPQGQGFNGGQPQGQDFSGGQPQGQGFNGGQPQGQGFNGGQPQGQNFNGGQPQGQGFSGGQPQGQGFNGGQPQGQDFSGGPPQGQGFNGGQPQSQQQYPGSSNQPQNYNPFGGQWQSFPGGQSPFQSFGGNPAQSIRKSLDALFSELFHPEGAHDPQLPNVTLPDLSHISRSCGRDAFFYSMNPMHQEAIENVKSIIFSYNTTAERISASNALRHSGEINPKVWYYALSGCSLHDPEMQKIHKPSPIEIMPDMFINAETCNKAQPGGQSQQQQPGFQQPGFQQPGFQQPGFQQPGFQQPGFQQPGFQQPGFQQPGFQQPGFQQPGFQQQPGNQGAPSSPRYRRQSQSQQQSQGQSSPFDFFRQMFPFMMSGQQQGQQQPRPQPPGQQQPRPQQPGPQQPAPQQPAPQQPGQCVRLDGSIGADNGPENVLWYFREDLQLNSHHWYWHLAYPPNSQTREDRRGELFYYVHASMLARYNADRLSNGLSRTILFPIGQNANIAQGYFAHLADSNSGRAWTDRAANVPFTDIIHQNDPNLGINIVVRDQILTATARLQSAIDQGQITTTNSGARSLMNTQGIDLLGDLIQSNRFSLNPNFYALGPAGLHNSGHLCFSEAMDPQFQRRTPPGPMADTATSMRDIVFYQWHAFMNSVFDRHKATLPPYAPTGGDLQLGWPGVQMVSLSVIPSAGGNPNQLRTFWNQRQFAFNRGLDFQRAVNSQPVNICAQYLDHGAFNYQIVVDKASSVSTTTATVRIFMAPRFDEQGNRFSMVAQRGMFFVMDVFTANLNPGRTTINRNSTDSTLTIPWQQTVTEQNGDANQTTPYCGCGWPHHLLLPKGNSNGMVFDLFVMLTNGDNDRVQQQNSPPNCQVAPPLCGVPNGLYPDAKPMGYPFDRLPYQVNGAVVRNLDEYEAGLTNVATAQVTITGPAN